MRTRRDKLTDAAVIIFCLLLVAVAAYKLGVNVTNGHLPNCQEDEFLYPKNYSGAGDNITSDYHCVHRDQIVAGGHVG